MRIVVTGARGFIGSHLVRNLTEAGHEVAPLGRTHDTAGRFALLRGDRLEPVKGSDAPLDQHFAEADAVAHLAALSQRAADDPLEYYLDANVSLTEQVALAATRHGLKNLVLASTRLVYPSTIHEAVSEDRPELPETMYGLSKRFAEQVVQVHASRGGWNATSLRIGQVVGPGDGGRGALARFVERAAAGQGLEVMGEGAAVRDVVHVEDVVTAFRLVLEGRPRAPAINIGSGRGYTIREMAELAARHAPAGPVEVRSAPTDAEDRSYYLMDCTLARSELGWEARPLEPFVADMLGAAAPG